MTTVASFTAGSARAPFRVVVGALLLCGLTLVGATPTGAVVQGLHGVAVFASAPCGVQRIDAPECTTDSLAAGGVRISVREQSTQAEVATVITDDSGRFMLSLLPGRYELHLGATMQNLHMPAHQVSVPMVSPSAIVRLVIFPMRPSAPATPHQAVPLSR